MSSPACKPPAWFATIFNSSGFCNISIEIQKNPWGWTSNHLCLLPFFRYEIRSTTVLFLQLCYSTFLMFFVSQKIMNCFMTVWTELCRFFNTCKCYFFFNHSSMVHPTFNTNFGTFCVSLSSLIFSKYLCMMPLSWMCLPKDFQNNSFWRRHSLVTLGVFVLLYKLNTIRVFFLL